MTWTFKDRFNSEKFITVNDDFPRILKLLGETFQDFRHHNCMGRPAQKKLISSRGSGFAKAIYIHTQISYCLGTHDCLEDAEYEHYCTTVKKHFIDVHPLFAMRAYAECISLISSDNESIKQTPLNK